jgi:hypothetical protein
MQQAQLSWHNSLLDDCGLNLHPLRDRQAESIQHQVKPCIMLLTISQPLCILPRLALALCHVPGG